MPTKLPRSPRPYAMAKTLIPPVLNDGGLYCVIERPKGYVKKYVLGGRPIREIYPVDYGSITGLINPEDGEDVDVFIGSGGQWCGRFHKGSIIGGKWQPDEHRWFCRSHKGDIIGGEWQPDEHKWFFGCTTEEVIALTTFWDEPRIVRDVRLWLQPEGQLARIAQDAITLVGAHH